MRRKAVAWVTELATVIGVSAMFWGLIIGGYLLR